MANSSNETDPSNTALDDGAFATELVQLKSRASIIGYDISHTNITVSMAAAEDILVHLSKVVISRNLYRKAPDLILTICTRPVAFLSMAHRAASFASPHPLGWSPRRTTIVSQFDNIPYKRNAGKVALVWSKARPDASTWHVSLVFRRVGIMLFFDPDFCSLRKANGHETEHAQLGQGSQTIPMPRLTTLSVNAVRGTAVIGALRSSMPHGEAFMTYMNGGSNGESLSLGACLMEVIRIVELIDQGEGSELLTEWSKDANFWGGQEMDSDWIRLVD